jgi:hypothetical protein
MSRLIISDELLYVLQQRPFWIKKAETWSRRGADGGDLQYGY